MGRQVDRALPKREDPNYSVVGISVTGLHLAMYFQIEGKDGDWSEHRRFKKDEPDGADVPFHSFAEWGEGLSVRAEDFPEAARWGEDFQLTYYSCGIWQG